MFRKVFFGIVALSLCLAFVADATAQTAVTTMAGPEHATSLEVGGNLQVVPIYRSRELVEFTGTGTGTPPQNQSQAFTLVKWELGLHAQATENIYGVLELENKQHDNTFAFANHYDGVVEGSADIGLAYFGVNEFMNPNLDLKVGIFDLNFDLRENGHPFLIDLTPESLGGELVGYNGGWWLTYTFNPSVTGDFYWVKMDETLDQHKDDDMYGIHVDWKLAGHTPEVRKVVHINVVVNAIRTVGVPDNHLVYTIGGGADYYLNPGLELYGELYIQAGEYADGYDAEAMAIYFGAKYAKDQWYLDGSIWYLTGDETASGDASENFMSFKGYHQAAILEDPVYGANLSNNFLALKIEAGYTTKFGDDDLDLRAFLGNYTMQEDNGGDDGIGTELDVTATWNLNPSLAFTLGAGFVFGSDVLEATTTEGDDSAMMLFLNSSFTF